MCFLAKYNVYTSMYSAQMYCTASVSLLLIYIIIYYINAIKI